MEITNRLAACMPCSMEKGGPALPCSKRWAVRSSSELEAICAAAVKQSGPHPAPCCGSQVCHAVRGAGMHCGIALKPATPAELVFPYVDAGLVDMVGLGSFASWPFLLLVRHCEDPAVWLEALGKATSSGILGLMIHHP